MKRVRHLFVVLVLIGLVAAACGNSDDDDDGGATTSAAPETTAAPDDGDGATTTAAPETTAAPDDGDDGDGGAAGGDPTLSFDASQRDEFVSISDVPGVSDEEIRFASIATKTGNPLGTCIMDCYNEGIEAYFAFRNDEGGIYGRELTLADTFDDELANNQVRAEEVVNGDYLGAFVATLLFSGAPTLQDAGVPTYLWGIHATEVAGRDALFGHLPAACANCTARTTPFLARESGATTVAALGYGVSENSKQCAGATRDSFEKYADELGYEVGYFNDDLAFGLPNGIAPEVTAMRDAGIDFIATCMDLNGMKTLGEELARQGMDDVVMYHPNTYNQTFVAEAGGVFDGDYVVPQFLAFEADTDNAMQDAFIEYMDQLGYEPSELAMIGWINADEAFTSLLAAGPDLASRQDVIDGFNTLTAYGAGGLIPPIDWTRQHNPPTEGDPANDFPEECFNPVQVQDGAFVAVFGEPGKPWICWPNDTLDWSEPVARTFQ